MARKVAHAKITHLLERISKPIFLPKHAYTLLDLRYANGTAKPKSFLSKKLLSKNSRKFPRTAAVGKKRKLV